MMLDSCGSVEYSNLRKQKIGEELLEDVVSHELLGMLLVHIAPIAAPVVIAAPWGRGERVVRERSVLLGWPAHDSGLERFATSFPRGSFIRYSLPALTGAFSDPAAG